MKENKINLLAILFMAIFVSSVHAQTIDGRKVAFVDLSQVFDQYSKTKEYDTVLEKKHTEYESARNKKLDKIREAQNKLSLLKDAEKAKLQEQMDKDRAELLEFDQQQQRELKKERDEKIREILLEIEKIVRNIAEKENYAMILNDRVLIFGSKELDITDKVLKQLNESLGSSGKK